MQTEHPDTLLYARVAAHYRRAIQSGVLPPGQRLPSLRSLVRQHGVSLSTVLQACRTLEDEGLLEARPRSGYFVQRPRRARLQPVSEPDPGAAALAPDPAAFAGIHDRVSDFVTKPSASATRYTPTWPWPSGRPTPTPRRPSRRPPCAPCAGTRRCW